MSHVEFEGFDGLVHNKVFAVPDYQRDYAWGKSDRETLIEDILSTAELLDSDKNHFMGSIVTIDFDETVSSRTRINIQTRELRKFETLNLIDGQQRLATISLFLVALRNCAREEGLSWNHEHNLIISGSNVPILNFADENTQEGYLQLLFQDDDKRSRSYWKRGAKNLLSNEEYFEQEIKKELYRTIDKEQLIEDLTETVLYRLSFVEISCKDTMDAFQVFESLNGKGLDLTPAELVKTYILGASASVSDALVSWDTMVDEIGQDNLVSFLTHFLFCKKQERVGRKHVTKEFSDLIKTNGAKSVLKQLTEDAQLYSKLRQPTSRLKSRNALEDLIDLKQEQVYSPLLSASKRFGITSKEFCMFADALLVYIVRHQVCGLSSNKLDSVFSSVIASITNESNNISDILAELVKNSPNDEMFIASFKELIIDDSGLAQKKARVYLRRIEEKNRGADAPLQLIRDELTVEHIIPRGLKDVDLVEWLNLPEDASMDLTDFRESKIRSIGNLALLYSPENSSASNNGFKEKKAVYTTSVINANGENRGVPAEVFSLIDDVVSNYTVFGEEQIDERANMLSLLANNSWRFID